MSQILFANNIEKFRKELQNVKVKKKTEKLFFLCNELCEKNPNSSIEFGLQALELISKIKSKENFEKGEIVEIIELKSVI